jgi:hypothetical protein
MALVDRSSGDAAIENHGLPTDARATGAATSIAIIPSRQ